MNDMSKILRNRVRIAALPILATAVVALTLALSLRSPAPGFAETPDDLQIGLLDQSNKVYLGIQLASGHPDFGHFVVTVDGVGAAWPDAPASVVVNGNGEYEVTYSGSGELDEDAELDFLWGWNVLPSFVSDAATIAVSVVIESDLATAQGTVTINSTQYTISTSPPAHDADEVVDEALG